MTYKEHCEQTKAVMGRDWSHIHHWLDEFAGIYWPSMVHRSHRHHRVGIEEARKLWGDEAAEAARMHIVADIGFVPEDDTWDGFYVGCENAKPT